MSGAGRALAESVSVLTPGMRTAGMMPSQAKLNATSTAGNVACGVKAMTMNGLCADVHAGVRYARGAILRRSGVWMRNVAGSMVTGGCHIP